MKRILKWFGFGLAGLVVLLAIVIVGGFYYLSAHMAQYKPRIEHVASQQLSAPVTIGSVALGWSGFGIEIDLNHLAVDNPKSPQPAVSARQISIAVSPLSFLHWPIVHPASIGILHPQFTVKQQKNGRFIIPGLPTRAGNSLTLNDIATRLSRIGAINVTDGAFVFRAPSRGIAQWQFRHLGAHVTGASRAIEVSLSVDPPKVMGQGFHSTFQLTRAPTNSGQWHWQGHVALPALQLDSLPKLLPTIPIDPHGGKINVHLSGSGTGVQLGSLHGVIQPVGDQGGDASKLTARLSWQADKGGTLRLRGADMAVALPDLFRWPLPLKKASIPLTIKHASKGWHIASKQFNLANADMTVKGQFSIVLPDDGSAPRIDVEAEADGIDLQHKALYLPVGIMPSSVVDWVDRSVKGGSVPKAVIVFHGKADAFPFRHGGGLFKVRFDLRDALIKFDPQWPAVKHLNAQIEFKNEGLSATVLSGHISGMNIANTTASIADLDKGVLVVNGKATGTAGQALNFMRHSPMAKRFGSYINKTHATGDLSEQVKIVLPLSNIDDYQIHGQAKLGGVDVQLADMKHGFENLKGILEFDKMGLNSPTGLTGQFLQAPVAIKVHPASDDDTVTQIDLDGMAKAATIEKVFDLSGTNLAKGQFSWHAQATLPNQFGGAHAEPLVVHVKSNLKGLALALPAPFGKPAGQAVKTSFAFSILDDGFKVKAQYGKLMHADLRLVDTASGVALGTGVIHFGAGVAHLPKAGLLVSGHLAQVALAKWGHWASLVGHHESAAASLKINADLSIGRVNVLGQHFDKVNVKLESRQAGYRVSLAGPDITGTILLPFEPDNKHPYDVSLSHLQLTSNFAENKVESKSLSPLALPPIKFSSEDTRIGDHYIGALKLELLKTINGVVLRRFSMALSTLKINAYGTWIVADGKQHTQLATTLKSSGLKTAFKTMGFPPTVTADKARMNAQLRWTGPPSKNILKNIDGVVTLDLENGSIPEVSPGAGRLLALLSVSALPRRFLFNFSDVFGKGFQFDSMKGTLTIINGNAYTNDFVLKSTIANVHMIGRVGLAAQDYDELVRIDASVGSSLPVAGIIAGGPVAGAALFLLTQIFKEPLKKATELEYHVTGPWDNPKMEPITVKPLKLPKSDLKTGP